MAGGKNKKKGQKKVGKEAPSTSLATDASPPMFPDTDFLLGYFDLSYSSLQRKDPRNALKIMWKSCEMHFTHPILHYWQSWFALEVFHEIYSGINYKREEILNPLSIARNAARRATIMSPHDIEFFRFYIEILAAISIYDEDVKEAIKETIKEAIEEGDQMLTLPEETMVFQEKLCSTHKKGAIITAIRALKEKLCSEMEGSISESPKSPLSKPIPFYRRVDKPKEKQIAVKLMPEIEQKKWRRSCWELMSDDKKVEFLALKYEDLRTFFLDKHLKHSKEVLMKVFSILIFGDSLLLPSCYTCGLFFEDYKKFIHHVRSNHIFQLSEHLKKLLPEDDKCEIRLPDTDDSKLSITVDKAKLTLHICNGTTGEISFEPENLKSLLPDPETFVNWLNLDEYVEVNLDDSKAAESAMFGLLNINLNELKSLCSEKHETITMVEKALVLVGWHCLEELKKLNCQKSTVLKLFKAVHDNLNEKFKDSPENVISIQYQFDVISDMIKSELDLTKDTDVLLSSDELKVHMDLVLKSRKELLDKECESIDSKLRETNTLKNQLESDLSCICHFDYSKHILPHLGLYIKAQLAELVLTYATEQIDKIAEQLTTEEAKKNATGGSNLSKQSVKNPKKKTKKINRVYRTYDDYEVAHQQEGAAEFQDCDSSIPQKEEQLQSESSVGHESKFHKVLECQRHPSDEMKQNIQHSEEETNTPIGTVCQSESSVGPESKLHEVLECQMHPSDEMKQNIQQLEEETNTPINTVSRTYDDYEVAHQQEGAAAEFQDCDSSIPQKEEQLQSESSVGHESKLHKVLECQRHPSDEMKQNIQHSEEETNTPISTVCQSESSVGPESKLHEVLECQMHPSDEMKQNIQQLEEETNTPINTVSRAYDDYEIAHRQEGAAELGAKISMEETTNSFSSIVQEDSAVVLSSALPDKDAHDSSTTINLIPTDNVNEKDLWQRLLINVIILPLCDLKPFRDELSKELLSHMDIRSAFFYELVDICAVFEKGSNKERDFSSILGKISFSKLFSASIRLQQDCYGIHDVLLAVFYCLHGSIKLSGDSSTKLNENTSTSLRCCENENCLAHRVFGLSIAEVTTYPCGLEAKRDRDTLFSLATASELYRHTESSFEQILKSAALHRQSVIQSTCGCSKYCNLCQKLLKRPHVFVAVINWEVADGDDYISTTFKTISHYIDLSALYDGVQSCSIYFLQSMICSSKTNKPFIDNLQSYISFIHGYRPEHWHSFDGKSLQDIGGWDAVILECETECFQPKVLMYVSEDSSQFK